MKMFINTPCFFLTNFARYLLKLYAIQNSLISLFALSFPLTFNLRNFISSFNTAKAPSTWMLLFILSCSIEYFGLDPQRSTFFTSHAFLVSSVPVDGTYRRRTPRWGRSRAATSTNPSYPDTSYGSSRRRYDYEIGRASCRERV